MTVQTQQIYIYWFQRRSHYIRFGFFLIHIVWICWHKTGLHLTYIDEQFIYGKFSIANKKKQEAFSGALNKSLGWIRNFTYLPKNGFYTLLWGLFYVHIIHMILRKSIFLILWNKCHTHCQNTMAYIFRSNIFVVVVVET